MKGRYTQKQRKEKNPSPQSPCVSLGSAKLPTVCIKVPAPTCEVLPGATSGYSAWENLGDSINNKTNSFLNSLLAC